MKNFIDAFLKAKLHVLVFLSSLPFLYLSFFSDFPSAMNQWQPTQRPDIHWRSMIVSGCMMLVSFTLAILLEKPSKFGGGNKNTEETGIKKEESLIATTDANRRKLARNRELQGESPKIESSVSELTVVQKGAKSTQSHQEELDTSPEAIAAIETEMASQLKTMKEVTKVDPVFEEKTVKKYLLLTHTQQDTIRTLYSLHRSELPLDDLYLEFEKKLPGQIGTKSEMFYRVKDLAKDGFLTTKAVGSKTTVVIRDPMVGQALTNRGLILT